MSDGDNPDETPRRDRGARGRFAPRNGIGPANGKKGGRPSRSTEETYLRAITDSVSEADWQAATKALLERAKEGDVRAFEALAKYLAPAESRTRVAVESAGADRAAAIEAALAEYAGMLDPGAETDSP